MIVISVVCAFLTFEIEGDSGLRKCSLSLLISCDNNSRRCILLLLNLLCCGDVCSCRVDLSLRSGASRSAVVHELVVLLCIAAQLNLIVIQAVM